MASAQPLLESRVPSLDEEASVEALTLRAQSGGRLYELVLQGDGACSITQVEEAEAPSCPVLLANLCRGSSPPAQIAAADIVGAAARGCDLTIWYAPMATKPGADKPARRMQQSPALALESPALAEQAAAHLRTACCWHGGRQPPRLLVIVNPASGPGRAPTIYEGEVRPALEAAGYRVQMYQTQAPVHATELVKGVAPGSVDAIVAIGGDGTMHETLQGMLGRPDWAAMAATPFAQIPCGSGNALAASMGLWTVATALHALVKGRQRALDIATVLQHAPAPRRCFSFLSINFGLVTNLDIGTEHLRWMGGTRFVVGALQQILLKRKHAARVALLDAPAAPAGASSGSEGAVAAAAYASASSSLRSSESAEPPTEEQRQAAVAGLAAAAAAPGPPVQQLAAFQQLAGQQLPPGWSWLPDPEVALFTATNLPRLDMNFHLAPDAEADSGHFNLIYSPPGSRREGFELLAASERGAHMHLVKQRRLTAMALDPRSTGTWLVVDGEVVDFSPMYVEVHPSLCRAIVAP